MNPLLTLFAEVLDEFKAVKIEANRPSTGEQSILSQDHTTAAQGSNDTKPDSEEDEFAKQLQAGMAELLGDMDKDPEMKKQFEQLMTGLGAGVAADDGVTASAKSTEHASKLKGQKTGEDSFQDTIRKTMERMQESGDQASAAASSGSQDEMFAQMLKEMEKSGIGGNESEEDFSKMLLGMMEQLTNKDILYEPMKELNDRFPGWMKENREKQKKEDATRYEEQQKLVSEIVARFELANYSDEKAEDREYIVERMQKVSFVWESSTNQCPCLIDFLDASSRRATSRSCWWDECHARSARRYGCTMPSTITSECSA